MARHSLYPGFIKLFYTGNGHRHVQTLPVKPLLSGAVWTVEKVLGGEYSPWTAAMDAYAVLFKAILNTADGLSYAELYTMNDDTADPLFREAYTLSVSGTSSTAAQANVETVIPHRTSSGGLLRWYVMEAVNPVGIVDRAPVVSSPTRAISDFLIASTGFVWGRDGGRPLVATSLLTKTNDALRKRYDLNS